MQPIASLTTPDVATLRNSITKMFCVCVCMCMCMCMCVDFHDDSLYVCTVDVLISQWESYAMMISLVCCISSHWFVQMATENK